MSKEYLQEVERMYDVTGGVNGLYADPEDDDMVIMHHDGNTIKFHKDFLLIANEEYLNIKKGG